MGGIRFRRVHLNFKLMKRILVLLVMMLSSLAISAQNVVRIGIIGLDTSHSTAYTKLINDSQYEWTE